ncbi:MAG: type II secretion system protein [Candidatus Sungbacteria bacterium]|uniref:Type II secretion system protein n=1 Tax=Candidatus Sungiibacteriota bacterium TaxID=2750080 RepID=A0A931WNU6_9BACT|nr:type II secretion system protein [Candidatus Sungbacteria bacterium]
MKLHKQNGFVIFEAIIAIAVFLALSTGIGFYVKEAKEQKANLASAEEAEKQIAEIKQKKTGSIDTSAWKTYRNEKYGFELRYPSNFAFLGQGPQQITDDYKLDDTVTFSSASIGFEIAILSRGNFNLSEDYAVTAPCGSQFGDVEMLENKIITVNGIDFFKRKESIGSGRFSIDYCFIVNGKLAAISYRNNGWGSYEKSQDGEVESLFDAILTTVKMFTPASTMDISTWKTYRNEKYGLEVKYPPYLEERMSPDGSQKYFYYCEGGQYNGAGRCMANDAGINIYYFPSKPFNLSEIKKSFDATILSLPFEGIAVGGKESHLGANEVMGVREWLVHIPLGRGTVILSFRGSLFIDSRDDVASNQEELSLMRKILSTFKFIETMCASNVECGSGFSCWYQIPRGAFAGIPGSKDKLGNCWSDEVLQQIY